MSITFYHGSGSPYAWRVWLALEHEQLPHGDGDKRNRVTFLMRNNL